VCLQRSLAHSLGRRLSRELRGPSARDEFAAHGRIVRCRLGVYDELKGEAGMADRRYGGITLGGIIVIVGVVLIIVWSFWIGLAVALIGLIAFGGFARGKWY
jgi:hypothetical protein